MTGENGPRSMEKCLVAVRDDLAARGVDVDGLAVRSAVERTWRDGSLGCPQPGVAYTQALVDGWRIVVEAAGRCWDYRAGRVGPPRLCRSGQVGGCPDDPGGAGRDFTPRSGRRAIAE